MWCTKFCENRVKSGTAIVLHKGMYIEVELNPEKMVFLGFGNLGQMNF